MRPPLLLIGLILGLVAFLAAGLAAVSADEDVEETPELQTITLHPGDNFVGWVDESMPLDELLVQLPRIEKVSTWDAVEQREVSATVEDTDSWSGPLRALEPGSAYVVRLGGDSSVEWTRPIVPAAGLVELRTGENWVAWLGPDDWHIEDVAKGIGGFLSEIRLGDHFHDRESPETADDWPTVERGDALVVTVTRDVIWLQPTFVMPQIHYAGNVGHGKRRLIERDLTATLDYSARELGVQADPFSMVVVVASGAKAAHGKITELGRQWEWESFENFWQQAGGWYMTDLDVFFLKASAWEGNRSGPYYGGRYVVLHEYVHALQYQLLGKANSGNPNWLLEGSANWFASDLSTLDRNGYPLSRRLINALNQASKGPPLEEIESSNKTWQYSFGLVAANMLVERSGKSVVLDFYRALVPDRVGPGGQWTNRPTIRSAFVAAFELTLDEFYEEFETLMAQRRGSAKRQPASNEVTLKGTIVNSDGTPRAGATLEGQEYKDGFPAGWTRRARSSEDGKFEIFLRKRADHQIFVRLSDYPIGYWWTSEGDNLAHSAEDADLIEVGTSDPPPLTITVEADELRWHISGVLSGPDDEPLAGIEVRVQGPGWSSSKRTEIDGSFELVTFSPGTHQLSVNLGGCWLYWSAEDHTVERSRAGNIEVVDQDVTDIRFMVSNNPCIRITGHLLDSNGNGIEGVWVNARADGDGVRDRTDANGRFEITLSEPGDYRLYAWIDGCRVYYRPESATGERNSVVLISVSEQDVNDLVFQLQEGMCSLRIAGNLLNADGSPKPDAWVRADTNGQRGGDTTSDDGSFSFTVPAAGSYQLSVTIDGCRVFYAGDGASGSEAQASTLNLNGSSITNIRFVLPENPCLSITGHLLDSNGNGIEGVWVNARADGDGVRDRTDANGRFEITLSEPGDYRLYAWIDGCRVYYRPESATGERNSVVLISVSEQDVNDLVFQLQEGMCSLRIAGNLLNADGSPKPDAWVRADTNGQRGGDTTSDDGSFSFTVPAAGSYQLSVTIDGCRVFYAGDGASGSEAQASTLNLNGSSITNIRFVLPENPCLSISGRLLDSNGNGIEGVWVNAQADGDGVAEYTDANGRFELVLSDPGEYQLYAYIDGCAVYYREGGATALLSERTLVSLLDQDVDDIRLQLEQDMCRLRISGKLLNADGTPKSGVWVSASGESGSGGAWSSEDGTFSFAVPDEGSYRLFVWIDDCGVYYAGDGATGDEAQARSLSLTNADVTGIDFRLPEDPSTFCN